jgi:hypothetical protein
MSASTITNPPSTDIGITTPELAASTQPVTSARAIFRGDASGPSASLEADPVKLKADATKTAINATNGVFRLDDAFMAKLRQLDSVVVIDPRLMVRFEC